MKKLLTALVVLGIGVAGAYASQWTGATDNSWDTLSNWDSDPSGGAAEVQTMNNYPVITADNTVIPNDVNIANATGVTGRVDVVSGTLNYVYWSKVGDWTGDATLNIADTSGSGGTYTGYGLGSGSYVSQNAAGNANLMVGLFESTGVLNMNTTGSLDTQGLWIAPNNQGGSGTFNLDAGTVNVTADMAVGSDFWGAGTSSDGHFNMSGGEVNVGGTFRVGVVNNTVSAGTSDVTMTGGTLNSVGDVVVGFAGLNGVAANMTIADGATVNVGTTGQATLLMGQWDETDATLEVSNGGTVNLLNGSDLSTGASTGALVINLDGGTIAGTAGSALYLGPNGTLIIANGGTLDVETLGLSGTIDGDLDLAAGTMLAFSTDQALTITGTLTLDSTFGVDDLVVADWSTVGNGTYTLVNGTLANTGFENVGLGNAYDVSAVGGNAGQQAYFEEGSLNLVVIPEPATIGLIGLAGTAMVVIRRRLMM